MTPLRTRSAGLVVGAVMCAATTPPASAQELTYSGSLGFATGDYIFTERTSSWAMLNGFGVRTGRMQLGLTLPVVLQNSTALSYIPGGAVPTGGPGHGTVSARRPGEKVGMRSRKHGTPLPVDSVAAPGAYELALGDPVLRGTMEVYRGIGSARSVEVALQAKLPLASIESGTGTEAWDVGAGASMGWALARLYVFLDATYWHLGDMPDLVLNDIVSYGAALGLPLASGRWTLLASVSGSTRIIDEIDAPLSAGLLIGFSPRMQRSFSLGVNAGLTEGSADLAVSVGWSIGSTRRPAS